jgi:hypothetical protein
MADPEKSIENLRSNLRASIKALVTATRNEKFNANNPDTQTLLKNFASKAHTYQKRAIAARNKLNGNMARANINAATVASVAGAVSKTALAKNTSPSRLRVVLNQAVALLAKIKPATPVASVNTTTKQNITGQANFPRILTPIAKRNLVAVYLSKKRNQVANRKVSKKQGLFARGWKNENLTRFWAAVNDEKATRDKFVRNVKRWHEGRIKKALPFNAKNNRKPLLREDTRLKININSFKKNLRNFLTENQANALYKQYWTNVPQNIRRAGVMRVGAA